MIKMQHNIKNSFWLQATFTGQNFVLKDGQSYVKSDISYF